MGGNSLVHHRDRGRDSLAGGDVGGDRVEGVVIDELKDHALTAAAEHVLGGIQLPTRIRGRIHKPPPRRAGLFLRLKTSHASLTEDACQRRRGRDQWQVHRVHLLVHADRPVI